MIWCFVGPLVLARGGQVPLSELYESQIIHIGRRSSDEGDDP